MGAFIGRGSEIARGVAAIEGAAGGEGALLLVAGDAGMGKTALARALAKEAASRGFAVLESRGWEGAGAPAFWPFIQVFRGLLREHDAVARAALGKTPGRVAKVARVVPEILSAGEGGAVASDDAAERFALFDAVAGWLRDVACERPLFVVLDDLHAADPSSLSMLQLVARELRCARVVVVGTYRHRGLPDGADVLDRLARIGREGAVVELEPLGRDDVVRMMVAAKGAAPPAIAEMVYRTSEGVPLFVEEILRAMSAPGAALLSGAPIPSGVRSVVRDRLVRLDADTQRELEAASVVGRTFTLALVGLLTPDVDAGRIHELVERAAKADVVERLAPGRYGFTQAMIREALYREIEGGTRAKLHATLADALEKGEAEGTLWDRAQHALRAAPVTGVARAVAVAEEAAAAAVGVSAFEDAAGLLRRALAVLDIAAGDAGVRARVASALARMEAATTIPTTTVSAPATPTVPARVTLAREGALWTATFAGALVRLKDSRGVQMLATLLERPGEEIHALTLSAASEGAPPGGDSGEALDREAIDAYRERVVELEDEIREAEAWNDAGRVERARTEMELLRAELSRAVGLGGRSRRAGSDAERARTNAQRRIKEAIRRIAELCPDAGKHLDRSVRTGTFCSYVPD
jgi:hypothetical protein